MTKADMDELADHNVKETNDMPISKPSNSLLEAQHLKQDKRLL